MGLIKALKDTIGSTLQDQWKDYIKCESMDGETLVKKVTTSSKQISKSSKIEIASGQLAIVYDTGKIVDVVSEEGVYYYDESTSPTFFAGEFKPVIKEAIERFTYDGHAAKEQAVYYINIKEIIGNRFGTSSPMSYDDPEYRSIYIRYYGMYSFKIVNPITFFENVVGNIAGTYKRSQLMEQANSEFLTALDTALGTCALEGIKFSRLPAEQLRIAKHMNEVLDEDWGKRRGLEIEAVAIEKITPDDESRKRIQKFDESAMYSKAEYAQGRMVEATANAMESAAMNDNGPANGFMGLGMMNMTMGNMGMQDNIGNGPIGAAIGASLGAASRPQQAQNQLKCPKCGTMASGKFCPECGASMIEEKKEAKKCPKCGTMTSGKFCPECGEKIPEEKVCSKCGNKVEGKFCPECGTKVEE